MTTLVHLLFGDSLDADLPSVTIESMTLARELERLRSALECYTWFGGIAVATEDEQLILRVYVDLATSIKEATELCAPVWWGLTHAVRFEHSAPAVAFTGHSEDGPRITHGGIVKRTRVIPPKLQTLNVDDIDDNGGEI